MATKLACTHPNCTYEGIFTIEDGEHLCMQHIHERIPWLPNGRRQSHLARRALPRQDAGAKVPRRGPARSRINSTLL